MAEMQAAVLHAPGDLRYESVRVPEAGSGEVLVRVDSCGVCGSDPYRVMVSGCYRHPLIPGHEFSGVISEVGHGVFTVHPGQRVAVIPIIPCMRCESCGVGDYNLCDDYDFLGSRSHGALAGFVKAPAANCIAVPDGVSLEAASMLDPITVALHGIRRAGGLDAGQDFVVLGAGPIGLFATQWARLLGAKRVVVVDILQEKLDLAQELGADSVVNATETEPVMAVLEATGGRGAHLVLESAGSTIAQKQSVRMARKHGRVINVGTSHEPVTFTFDEFECIRRRELTIFGSINYSFSTAQNEWKTALAFLGSGQMQADGVVSHRFALGEAPKVFPTLFSREVSFSKVLFKP
jgi:L-iditol 2-dehydrogenase